MRLETLEFTRRALEKGIRSYNTKLKRSELLREDPRYQPLCVNMGWRRNEIIKTKIMKNNKWLKPSDGGK